MNALRRSLVSSIAWSGLALSTLLAAERSTLNEENWDAWVPQGKEVDCIYGDIVLRNDQLIAVIAQPLAGRNANMTVRNVGGAVIDLTQRHTPNDQLSAFYPGATEYNLTAVDPDDSSLDSGPEVQYRCRSEAAPERPQLEVTYRLVDGQPWLNVECNYRNPHEQPITFAVKDSLRADRSFEFTLVSESNLFVSADSWWHQTYALVGGQRQLVPDAQSLERGRPVLTWQHEGSADVQLAAGECLTLSYQLIPAANTLQLHGLLRQHAGDPSEPVALSVRDAAGPIANALVRVLQGDQLIGQARTDHVGRVTSALAPGEYRLHVEALGRPLHEQPLTIPLHAEPEIELDLPGYVRARIRDEQGRRIPCKVEFRGKSGTADPFFGPDTYEEGVHNLVYSSHGQFRQEMPPGQYDVIISHGPEYDAVFTTLDVVRGDEAMLEARLRRSVESPGWISSDFHSHSSPSGDNTSSQRGRVLNLLCEHLEFAPCTEHNRISTYEPHLEFLQAEHLMATCSGMELTGQPLPVNHQNAFPLIHKPRTQDGGGPQTDENPVVQIERLALWDLRAEKVVQGNHPNLRQIAGDRDLDGTPDGGFERMLAAMDVVEVHPPQDILQFPTAPPDARDRGNAIYNWLQLLNQGYRIPGVVNTDAHYNFHGSGWLRNYLKSSADDPAEIKTADMIRAAEAGNIIMTNGPYLEVSAETLPIDSSPRVTAGDNLLAPQGKLQLTVRVQCANWLDINRVFLLFNGQPQANYDFRRLTHADHFQQGVVKFERTLPLTLDGDTHIVVVAVGEDLKLGPVVGPQRQDDPPIAVANPIYVDVNADGFRPNGDSLGVPLPLRSETGGPAAASR
jgi:hypothetical protein